MISKGIKAILVQLIKLIVSKPKVFEFFRKKMEENYLKYNLKILELEINTIYDIGANKGEWAKYISKIYPKSKIYLFEANAKNEKFLLESGFEYFIECLSDKEEKVQFYGIGGTGDSLYREDSDIYKNIDPITIQSTTLNSTAQKHQLPSPDFIKIDTQGSEIDILKGALNLLKQCKLLQLEISITQTNLNAPTIGEYLDFLNKVGFQPMDIIERHNRNKTELSQVDILFINTKVIHSTLI